MNIDYIDYLLSEGSAVHIVSFSWWRQLTRPTTTETYFPAPSSTTSLSRLRENALVSGLSDFLGNNFVQNGVICSCSNGCWRSF